MWAFSPSAEAKARSFSLGHGLVLHLSREENKGNVRGSLGSRGEEEEEEEGRACGWRVELEASIVIGWFGDCGFRDEGINIYQEERMGGRKVEKRG